MGCRLCRGGRAAVCSAARLPLTPGVWYSCYMRRDGARVALRAGPARDRDIRPGSGDGPPAMRPCPHRLIGPHCGSAERPARRGLGGGRKCGPAVIVTARRPAADPASRPEPNKRPAGRREHGKEAPGPAAAGRSSDKLDDSDS